MPDLQLTELSPARRYLVLAICSPSLFIAGVAVLVVGLISTGPWAQRTAARNGDRLVQLAQEGSDDRSAAAVR